MRHCAPTLALIVCVAALAAAGRPRPLHAQGPVADPLSPAPRDLPESREATGSIRKTQRLSAEEGWALTDKALLFTREAGKRWSNMTAGQPLDGVTDAFFLTASHAWLAGVDPGSPDRLVVRETIDGGTSWRTLRVEASVLEHGQVYAGAQVHFVNDAHGWLLGKVATSTAFSLAELLRTTDGGASWERLPRPPRAGRFVFVDAQRGFMTSAPVSTRLYRTLDGGQEWQELRLRVSATPGMALYHLPVFSSLYRGTIAVTLRGESPRLLTFVTKNGGRRWSPAASRALPAGDYDEPVPMALSRGGAALAVQGTVTLETGPAPRALSLVRQDGALSTPSGERAVSVRALSLTEDGSCWALVDAGGCEKSVCRQVTRLADVSGGGVKSAEDLLVRTEQDVQQPLEPELAPSGAVISFDKGFDKCEAPSLADMQTWKTFSPYSFANIYYGGEARACAEQPYLDVSWVRSVFAQGWRLIPTWVGPQAPCSDREPRFSPEETEARNQGLAEANAAVDAAGALGFAAGTPLYYNLERYPENTCSVAVRAFVNAWTERVKERGYLAGVYGNPANAQADWVTIDNSPDAVWLASWVCDRGTETCDWSQPTVFSIPGLDDAYWPNNQRIRQYWGDHRETHGGVSLTVDADYANGPLAAPSIDLEVSAIDFTPTPAIGVPTTAIARLANLGLHDSGPFKVRWSLDGAPMSDGIHDSLGPGEVSNGNVKFRWTPTTPGTHTLRFEADVDHVVHEIDETNNDSQVTFMLPDIDLEVSGIRFTSTPAVGVPTTAIAHLANVGLDDSGPFNVRWSLDGAQVGYGRHDSLAGGEVSNGNVEFRWTPTTPGAHTLQFEADVDRHAHEVDETNNHARVLVILPDIDLRVSGIRFTSTPTVGVQTTAIADLANLGRDESEAFNVRWFLDGAPVSYGRHDSLAGGETSGGNVEFHWTPTPGTHTLRFAADVEDVVHEVDESNNHAQVTVSAEPRWSRSLIEYRFDSESDFNRRVVRNWGLVPFLFRGRIIGQARQPDAVLGKAIEFDDETTYVEVENSRLLSFGGSVMVQALVRRESNANEDAIASKWRGGQDQWLLTFNRAGNGLLVFAIRLRDGTYASLEYPIPTNSYLGSWVQVAARFERNDGLRLYWNGQQVAYRGPLGQGMASGRNPIHIGDAGPGATRSRFGGQVDEIRIGPSGEQDLIDVSYSYSFGDLSGRASVLRGDTLTIWDEPGGCGPLFPDTAQCQTNHLGQVRAFNHDCLSKDGPGTFGPWVSRGCSTAEEFGFVVECCREP